MCSTPSSMAFCRSAAHSSSVCLGNPKIRSMLILLMPTSLSLSMAGAMSVALCRLRRNVSRSSENVCTPMLTRLTGRRLMAWANWGVMSSGLHSMVTSTLGEIWKAGTCCSLLYSLLYKVSNSRCKFCSLSCEGVPPPK